MKILNYTAIANAINKRFGRGTWENQEEYMSYLPPPFFGTGRKEQEEDLKGSDDDQDKRLMGWMKLADAIKAYKWNHGLPQDNLNLKDL